jgi:diguanylate cyclase (GGDEF)-like protein/PAS domain S-box-containing protein
MDTSGMVSETDQKRTLRLLFVEDNPDDLELIVRELRKAPFDVVADAVRTKAEFAERLRAGQHDAIVADYHLDGWTGIEALNLMRDHQRDLPFILVTGALGEEAAVDCVKHGVSDYILKDRLARLPIAIDRSIREAELSQHRRKSDQRVRDREAMFRTLAEAIDAAIFVYVGAKCLYANYEAENLTGHSREELVEMNSLSLVDPKSREDVIRMGFRDPTRGAVSRHCEIKITTKSGDAKWLSMTSRVIPIEGKLGRLVTAFDITQRRLAEEETRLLALTDPLTGLGNYRRLLDAFDSELARSQRTGRPFSLMLLDLDGLKQINDVYGHAVGSRALCRVGHVLRAQCRNVDVATRYGGDEFAVILPETNASDARHLARRIAKIIKDEPERPSISVSLGLAACPDDGNTFNKLLRIADAGLYSMKGYSHGFEDFYHFNLELPSSNS